MNEGTASPSAGEPSSGGSFDRAMQALLAPLGDRLAAVEEQLRTMQRKLEAPVERRDVSASRTASNDVGASVSAALSPFWDEPPAAPSTTSEGLEAILLSPSLCENRALDADRARLASDVSSGDLAARGLAGQLLLVQAANSEELPERLKHVGEAYYRWRSAGQGDDPFEQALADWLTQRAEAAGLKNSIQLVRVGDRFDSSRHTASGRGVEVAAVRGWIVLRDNNKVYTKADVVVK